ncbi:MAG: hypothetical protein AAGJ83_00995 [Planctomycetota bacterium]
MDELRIQIWDALYQSGRPMSVAELADRTGVEESEVTEAINHDWFEVVDGSVRIAESP